MTKIRASKFLISILAALVLLVSNVAPAVSARNYTPAVDDSLTINSASQQEIEKVIDIGLDYIASQINDDGGVRWMDESGNVSATIRLILALKAANYLPDHVLSSTGAQPIHFLQEQASAWVNQLGTDQTGFSTARAGQLLTAIAAADENPHNFGPESLNLVYALKSRYDPNRGVFGNATFDNVLDQIWAILGLSANYASIPEESASWLAAAQLDDGSWDDGFGSYLNTTPLAVMALIASGYYEFDSDVIQGALEFIRANQQPNGGWQTTWDSTTNANTTGVILQAITALGQDPTSEPWQKEEGDPISVLMTLQGDNGAIGGDFANTYSTADAILGLSGQPLYELGSLRRIGHGFEYLIAAQENDGGWGSVGQTLDMMMALRAAGWDPNTLNNGQNTPATYLESNLEVYLESGPDTIGKTILALVAAGADPRDFNGTDLIKKLLDAYDGASSAFGDPENTWHQALPILGLNAAGEEIPIGAIETLLILQQDDGGWEYSPGLGTHPDNTALATQALLSSGYTPKASSVSSAIEYLHLTQNDDGGWGDSSTTAYVIMAINGLGDSNKAWITNDGKNPVGNLLTYQKANGSFVLNWDFPDDNLMATGMAMLALFNGDYIAETDFELTKKAAILVALGEDTPFMDCIAFEEGSISGLDLLDRSIFTYNIQEGFIKSIIAVGNPEGGTNYWSYWAWNGREWVFNNMGAGESQVLPGTIEAWHFTSWEVFPSLPPNFVPHLNEICHGTVLKNYVAQPYIDFKDLQPPFVIEEVKAEPVIGELEEESTQVVEDSPAHTETLHDKESSTQATTQVSPQESTSYRSPLPIIIIGFVGLAALILILIIILKRPK